MYHFEALLQKRSMHKGFVFTIHSVAGLVSGLFILLMSLSGAALVFHEELDSLQYPHIVTQAGQPVLPVDSCYRSLQKQYPHAQVSSCSIAENTGQPFVFTVYDSSFQKGTRAMQVFSHPQTAAIHYPDVPAGRNLRDDLAAWFATAGKSFIRFFYCTAGAAIAARPGNCPCRY